VGGGGATNTLFGSGTCGEGMGISSAAGLLAR